MRGETVLEHGVHPPVNDVAHRADAASEVAVEHWQLIRKWPVHEPGVMPERGVLSIPHRDGRDVLIGGEQVVQCRPMRADHVSGEVREAELAARPQSLG